MPRKLRELIQDLKNSGAVTLSGQLGSDAKPYQEKQVQRAIEEIKNEAN